MNLSDPEIEQLLKTLEAMVNNSAIVTPKDQPQLQTQSLLYPPESYGPDALAIASFGGVPDWLSRFFSPELLEKLFVAGKMGMIIAFIQLPFDKPH
ncbi:hypothetical protein FRC03_008250 [Tulasnella sp. 419]|nr:hypothetical protein FRC03_008250 [Tulasnella sp. 419]